MSDRHIFHLALHVGDLEAARRFYVDVLGARLGRTRDTWLDILLWGHQITLHHRPDDILSREAQGKRHFGAVLPWEEWEALAADLRARGVAFMREPTVLAGGTPDEHAKLSLEDPSHHVLEIKAYRNAAATLQA